MVRIGLERALVPDLRQLVVAELAIGVADQIRDIGAIFMAERLQLLDGGSKIVAVVDRGIGGAIAGGEALLLDSRRLLALLLAALAAVAGRGRRRGRIAAAGGKSRERWRAQEDCGDHQRQQPNCRSAHASLPIPVDRFESWAMAQFLNIRGFAIFPPSVP